MTSRQRRLEPRASRSEREPALPDSRVYTLRRIGLRNMGARRTAPAKVIVPDERHDDLHESLRQLLHCANRGYEVNTGYNAAKRTGLRYARNDARTPFLARVGERRRLGKRSFPAVRTRNSPTSFDTGRRAHKWWDGKRRESPAYRRGLSAGSLHQNPNPQRANPVWVGEAG